MTRKELFPLLVKGMSNIYLCYCDNFKLSDIQHYLENNNLLDSKYVIIDDDTADIIGDKYNGMDFNPHFVWCNNKYGFQRKEYKKALKILKGDNYDNSKSK